MTTAETAGQPSRAARIEAALRGALAPARLSVEDESARHAGHAGARAGGQTHYKVSVVSSRFEGMGRLARSRLVHTLLQVEFDTGLHALSLILHAPGEVSSL
jgi:BolA protein